MASDESRAYSMVLEWWGLLPRPVRRRELGDFAMEFAYHSARVEGAELTYEESREVFEQGSVIGLFDSVAQFWSHGSLGLNCLEDIQLAVSQFPESVEAFRYPEDSHFVKTSGGLFSVTGYKRNRSAFGK